MFTVLHIEQSGHETHYLTKRVTVEPTPAEGHRTLFIENQDGSTSRLEAGQAFVMNENGKTVSKYYLGLTQAPQ